ncbi:MAG: HepT-like ribonuclease domain-containing protein [Methanothrix sp.]
MNIERAGRYKDKLDLIFKRAGQAHDWLEEVSSEVFLEDDKTKLASYKAFQEAVEACQDLVAMMCKDLGIKPQDDYSNLERLNVLTEGSKKVLIEANGLRNHLVHRYNKRDDLIALESMRSLLSGIMAFGEEVEAWLEKMLPPG